jgi:hypothetical protein
VSSGASFLMSCDFTMPKAEYLKLFAGDTSAMVALFTSDQGWIENIPADHVFSGDIQMSFSMKYCYRSATSPPSNSSRGSSHSTPIS